MIRVFFVVRSLTWVISSIKLLYHFCCKDDLCLFFVKGFLICIFQLLNPRSMHFTLLDSWSASFQPSDVWSLSFSPLDWLCTSFLCWIDVLSFPSLDQGSTSFMLLDWLYNLFPPLIYLFICHLLLNSDLSLIPFLSRAFFVSLFCKENELHQTREQWVSLKIKTIFLPVT